MLWGQEIKVFTDHKNLTRDALGLTSDTEYTDEGYFLRNICQE
jgi:hypothetical protein